MDESMPQTTSQRLYKNQYDMDRVGMKRARQTLISISRPCPQTVSVLLNPGQTGTGLCIYACCSPLNSSDYWTLPGLSRGMREMPCRSGHAIKVIPTLSTCQELSRQAFVQECVCEITSVKAHSGIRGRLDISPRPVPSLITSKDQQEWVQHVASRGSVCVCLCVYVCLGV